MNFEQKVFDEIDRLRTPMTTFLQQLVQIPSLPGLEQAAQTLSQRNFARWAGKWKFCAPNFAELAHHPAFSDDGVSFDERINVVARWKGSGNGHSLILNGHMDVVPVGNLELWKYPPWSGTVENGLLHGRGSCDMKAGLTAAVFALQALQNVGLSPAGDLLLESVIGEESGGVGTLTTLIKGVRADAAIIMEPTRLRSCPVHAGALSFRIVVTGRAIHASMKRFGVSAVEKFTHIFEAIEALDRDRHLQYQNNIFEFAHNIAPISVGTVVAGDWVSTVPEVLVAKGRFGVFPGEPIASARAALAAMLASVTAADPWLREHPPSLDWIEGQFEPGQTSLSEPIVLALTEAHTAATGEAPKIQGVPYGSDLRLFTVHGQIPAVLYGPGDVAFAHTVEEHVILEEVFTCAKTLALLIQRGVGCCAPLFLTNLPQIWHPDRRTQRAAWEGAPFKPLLA